jgi:Coenzyme PQQ synthesis protein D (PqqD)
MVARMHIDLSTVVKQSGDQISCELNEETAILNMQSAQYFGLDEVGSVIWQELAEEKTVRELCSAVVDQFEVDEAQCRLDVIEFLDALIKAGLIEILPSSHPKDAP